MNDVVTVDVDPGLSVSIAAGEEWVYSIEIVYDGESVTQYGSNVDPWGESGQLMLRNIVAARIDGYDRSGAERSLARAFEEQESRLEDAFE